MVAINEDRTSNCFLQGCFQLWSHVKAPCSVSVAGPWKVPEEEHQATSRIFKVLAASYKLTQDKAAKEKEQRNSKIIAQEKKKKKQRFSVISRAGLFLVSPYQGCQNERKENSLIFVINFPVSFLNLHCPGS